ncbi:uncharacterized protein LOC125669883 isoform X2 [Ostrea edulis]|uniref:uncharacterized protein LOC125669883 isoform X2 n=1 Tax=Ostrea edulis TaxID=37623 RepID=UPI0024AF1A9E|nr:uncharacterized protein LOC125669883 isoform X2 [Ostrea edulis]
MLLTDIILFSIVTVVTSRTLSTTPTPYHCCWSPVKVNKFRMIGGKVDPKTSIPEAVEYSGINYRDHNIKKAIMFRDVPQPDGSVRKEIEYSDYNTMKWYVISEGVCTEHIIKYPMPDHCVPPNATYTGDTVLGEEGYPQVRLHNYNLDWIDFRGYNIRISTDARTCDTMTETDYGDIDGAKAVYTYFFSDHVSHIDDYSIFDIPVPCRHFVSGNP